MFFSRKPKIVEALPYIRRICDLSTPNHGVFRDDRSERRYNRTLPAILCPWHRDSPVIDQCTTAITKDLCDGGLSLIVRNQFQPDEDYVVGLWLPNDDMPEPWFFRTVARSHTSIGAGFWQAGFELQEFMNTEWKSQLSDLFRRAEILLPHACVV